MAQTLNNDETPDHSVPQTNDAILESLFPGYSKAATIEAPASDDEPEPAQAQTPVVDGVKYYKTGPKAGQPRPNRNKTGTTPPANGPTPPPGEMQINGELLSGALFITLIDLLLPFLIEVLNNRFSNVKISGDDLKLTASQKKELAPISDAVVKKLNLSGNPVVLMFIALGSIYAINTASLRSLRKMEMKDEAKKEAAKNSK